jgi:hypothetical protein
VSAFDSAAFDAVAYDTTPVTLALPVRVDISALAVAVGAGHCVDRRRAGHRRRHGKRSPMAARWPLSGGWWSRSVASMSAIACSAK